MLGHGGVPLLAGLAYCLVAFLTIYIANGRGSVAPIWPANALLLALALRRPRIETVPIIGFGAIGTVLSMLLIGYRLPTACCYAASHIVEMSVVILGLRGLADRGTMFSEPGSVTRFLLWAGFLAPLSGACLSGTITAYLSGGPFAPAFTRWFMADALGMLIFTPLVVALISGDFRQRFATSSWSTRLEFAALLSLAAIASWVVFHIARNPLLFVLMMPLMLVSFRTGWLGTKAALAIVAIIGGSATLTGNGPIPQIAGDTAQQVYYFQIYMAALLLTQMPIAASLTAREALIERLRESEQSLRMLAARSPILLLAFDLAGRCERVVGTSMDILGREAGEVIGGGFAQICSEGQYELRRAHNAALDDLSQNHPCEFRAVNLNNAWLEAVFRAHFDEAGRCIGTVATIHDVTLRKNQELSLSRTATTDSLTGLLNRAGFRARLEGALLTARPGMLSIAMIDVDRFKLINDNSGHQVGDIVLREIARRISGQVRASDAVGRLGGDEFVILLPTPNWDMVQEICARIVGAVGAEPVSLPSGNTLHTAISCGVTRFREGLSADDFINEADIALYEAKRGGRNRVVAA